MHLLMTLIHKTYFLALCWDLATEKILFSTKSYHSDYIRALDANSVSPDIFATGKYL